MTVDPDSIWLGAEAPTFGSSSPGRVDVAVIGAGLAGLCTAYQCHADGASVALIEAGSVARRTTGHSTAKITALHGLTYERLTRGKGLETAVRYAAANTEALIRLRDLADRLEIECAMTTAAAYTCAASTSGVANIEAEAEAAAAAGLPVELVTETELPFRVESAVRLDDQAHFDPYAFCSGLAQQLDRAGVAIVEQTRAIEIEERRDGCTIQTADGESFQCEVAVQTTHLPVVDPALIAARVRPQRSYALAASMPDPPTGMYLAPDAGWSIRPGRVAGRPYVIVGGQGHDMTDHVESAEHYEELARWARDRLGVEATHQWSAFDYATSDGVPFIGALTPRSRRRYLATGFHKWGMSTSMLSAVIISDLIAGRDNPYAETFDSTRVIPTVSRDLAKSVGQVAKHWIGDRVSASKAEPEHGLAIGESKIVREGTRVIGLALTRDGRLHEVDATCTHLGCVVAFNAGEETWDCPCHGSRFTPDGAVVDGPAVRPLARRPSDSGDE